MNNRFKTDFLFASSSFVMGLGSVLNLQGHSYEYNSCEDPDGFAILNDWRMVGQDIGDSLEKAKKEVPSATPNE
jgi:hypothetical protein